MPILILLNLQAYQAPESVMMNDRVHYFHDLGLLNFYRIKCNVMDHSWLLAMNHICKYKKPCLYVHKKIA